MIPLEEKDADWVEKLIKNRDDATVAAITFGNYLQWKYEVKPGMKLDINKRAFIEKEESDKVSG